MCKYDNKTTLKIKIATKRDTIKKFGVKNITLLKIKKILIIGIRNDSLGF